MKRIVFISIVISAMLFNSCVELELERPYFTSEGEVFTDAAKTEMALLGLYFSLKGSNANFLGGRTFLAFDAIGNDIRNIDPNGVTLANTYAMAVIAGHAESVEAWYFGYLAINRANVFIESLVEYETDKLIGAPLAAQYTAEAKFVRALANYYLVSLFAEAPYVINRNAKGIPLRLTAIKEHGHSDKAFSSIGEVYEAILNDLSAADIAALPTTTTVKTRATKAAPGFVRQF